MKKRIFTLLLAVAASIGTMFAWDYDKVQIGELLYNIDTINRTAEVTTRFILPDYINVYAKWNYTIINIPSVVTYKNNIYSVNSIGEDAFYNCTGLTSVTIPDNVTKIAGGAFYNCNNLTYPVYNAHIFAYMPTTYSGAYIIPDGIESIAGGSFSNCSGLTSVTIPNSVTNIGRYAFYECDGLTSVTIPNSVTCIEDYAFTRCTFLASINIPDSIISIGNHAFEGCTALTSVTIPNILISIGEYAFCWCTNMISVSIGNGVKNIGDAAFYNCIGLTSVTIDVETPPTIGEYVFDNDGATANYPIYVQCEAVEAYKNAWSSYANRIAGNCQGIEGILYNPVQCTKILHNGKLFIISEKKTYTLTGQETK